MIDVILSDHTLPMFDGISALEIACEWCSNIPFIFVSGTMGEEIAIEALKRGATDYVLKDRLSRLAPVVKRALKEIEYKKERKKMENTLRQAEKMQVIGKLAGGIAHDFNNLLTGIMGYTQILKNKINIADNLMVYVDKIIEISNTASDHISKLMNFARQGKCSSEPVDMHQIIQKLIPIIHNSINKSITIKTNLLASSAIIIGDYSQLQNALLNLAINARDAMPYGGVLSFNSIIKEIDRADGEYCSVCLGIISGRYLVISVSDTGIGMTDEIMEQILNPFFTTKAKGTGLGLSSAAGCIKEHHGHTKVKSKHGEGTTFILYLPLAEKQELQITENNKQIEIVSGKGTIMLVDDDDNVRESVSDMLRMLGYDIYEFEDGLSAIDFFKEKFQKIDLVLLDMIMPKINGRDTFMRLKEIDSNVKVIITTGLSDKDTLKELFAKGLLEVVKKPIRITEISKIIANALNSTFKQKEV